MLNQDAMTPLYVQLMEEVEKSIRSGEYKPGDRLMTEAEMAKKYGVSLITVRKAMRKGLWCESREREPLWSAQSCFEI